MSDDENVRMYPLMCDAECGRRLGWIDTDPLLSDAVKLCNHCMDHPHELMQRLGEPS